MPPKRTREGEDKVPADAGADAAAADATALVNLRADADAVECRLVEARGRALEHGYPRRGPAAAGGPAGRRRAPAVVPPRRVVAA